jgi:3-methyladenine DNA glycosylase AlkD
MIFSAEEISRRLHELADPKKAKDLLWFFKTGKGQYGEGDVFIGVMTPKLRLVVKSVAKDTTDEEVKKLLASPIHEERSAALQIWVAQFAKADENRRREIYENYLASSARINNWDLVDCSAPQIVGGWLEKRDRAILYTLAESKSLWERRISILATFAFIRSGDFIDTLSIAKILLGDPHDLIHKATGWMLREVGKRDEKVLRDFLDKYGAKMPRTALRYAIEKFPEKERKAYLLRKT